MNNLNQISQSNLEYNRMLKIPESSRVDFKVHTQNPFKNERILNTDRIFYIALGALIVYNLIKK